MTIGTDAAIDFFGSQTTLDDTSAEVTTTSISVATDLLTFTNSDDAPRAEIILEVDYVTAPTANSSVTLLAQLLDIISTTDADIPTTTFKHTFLGTFPIKAVDTAQVVAISISLPNLETSQQYKFFIINNTDQTIPAGWDLTITPKTIGPHA